jgi:hypothetical protein
VTTQPSANQAGPLAAATNSATAVPAHTMGVAPSPALMKALQEAANRIDDELERRASSPMSLSASANDKLTIVQTEILADIGTEAVKIARRQGLSTVDERHVDEAANRLGVIEKSSSLIAAINNIGGILTGAGLAALYAILFTEGPHGSGELLMAFGLNVVGISSMVWSTTVSYLKSRS